MTAFQWAGRRLAVTVAWGSGSAPPRPTLAPPPRTRAESAAGAPPTRPQAGHPATVGDMSTPAAERAAMGGKARAERLDPERRREIAREASRAARSASSRARQLANAWPDADEAERRAARKILREAGIVRVR